MIKILNIIILSLMAMYASLYLGTMVSYDSFEKLSYEALSTQIQEKFKSLDERDLRKEYAQVFVKYGIEGEMNFYTMNNKKLRFDETVKSCIFSDTLLVFISNPWAFGNSNGWWIDKICFRSTHSTITFIDTNTFTILKKYKINGTIKNPFFYGDYIYFQYDLNKYGCVLYKRPTK